MAVIQVNHQALRNTAQAIDDYCDTLDKEMKQADSTVMTMLVTDWVGRDASDFRSKWEDVDNNDSVVKKFRSSLRSYSKALRSSANAYQDAQETAYNLASLLPR